MILHLLGLGEVEILNLAHPAQDERQNFARSIYSNEARAVSRGVSSPAPWEIGRPGSTQNLNLAHPARRTYLPCPETAILSFKNTIDLRYIVYSYGKHKITAG